MSGVVKSYLVPGLPHLVHGNGAWTSLKNAYKEAAAHALAEKPDVLVIYSAQWISVLGHSFQADPNPKGLHVDDNWYAMGDFPFSFKTDTALTEAIESAVKQSGFATKLVNYEGFPIDTGTLVALSYFNPNNEIPVVIVSSNIYCSQQDSYKLGQLMGEAIEKTGRKAVLINCSALSHRFITDELNPNEDHIASPKDDEWNQRILELMKQGKNQQVMDLGSDYAKEANPEMQFKGFYWMMGAMGKPTVPANVLAYGPIWGTGAAVAEYSLN